MKDEQETKQLDLRLGLKMDPASANTLTLIGLAFAAAWMIASVASCTLASDVAKAGQRSVTTTTEVTPTGGDLE